MNRKDLCMLIIVSIFNIWTIQTIFAQTDSSKITNKLTPILFISTGTPANIIESNEYTKTLNTFGSTLKKPKTILVISSHWLSNGNCLITSSDQPEILHDYIGMPESYYEIKYPFTGNAELAQQIIKMVSRQPIQSDIERGIDYGAWAVCKQLFPEGNIPIVQISLNQYIPPSLHYEIAKQLKTLRAQEVMIICSGNIVYNTRFMHKDRDAAPFYWALNFDTFIKDALDKNNIANLIDFRKLSKDAKFAVPANQQYVPLMYAVGLKEPKEKIKYIYEGFQNASISLRSFMIE